MIYANCDMNPIQGERFQDLCETQISKIEHKEFESNSDSIDIDNSNSATNHGWGTSGQVLQADGDGTFSWASLAAAPQKVDYGVYSGTGSSSARTISTGITTVKAVFIWEKPGTWDDDTTGNRSMSQAYDFYISTETFGDYQGEEHMAIHRPFSDRFYGGRINFAGSNFFVYHTGTYWTGTSNSINASGQDYYWMAIGD